MTVGIIVNAGPYSRVTSPASVNSSPTGCPVRGSGSSKPRSIMVSSVRLSICMASIGGSPREPSSLVRLSDGLPRTYSIRPPVWSSNSLLVEVLTPFTQSPPHVPTRKVRPANDCAPLPLFAAGFAAGALPVAGAPALGLQATPTSRATSTPTATLERHRVIMQSPSLPPPRPVHLPQPIPGAPPGRGLGVSPQNSFTPGGVRVA